MGDASVCCPMLKDVCVMKHSAHRMACAGLMVDWLRACLRRISRYGFGSADTSGIRSLSQSQMCLGHGNFCRWPKQVLAYVFKLFSWVDVFLYHLCVSFILRKGVTRNHNIDNCVL